MELYVLSRHGESTLNSENRINGNPDVPVALTEKGRDEARLCRGSGFARVHSSPFRREPRPQPRDRLF